MADLTREELQRLARLGAQSRLDEIRREEAAIRRAFPDLFGGKGVARAAGVRRRRRSNMSAAGAMTTSAMPAVASIFLPSVESPDSIADWFTEPVST